MPSLPHEGIVELFRNRPVLAAEILQEAFDVPLPRFTEARIESAELGDVIPRELRADLLVLLLDGKPVLVIIGRPSSPARESRMRTSVRSTKTSCYSRSARQHDEPWRRS